MLLSCIACEFIGMLTLKETTNGVTNIKWVGTSDITCDCAPSWDRGYTVSQYYLRRPWVVACNGGVVFDLNFGFFLLTKRKV